MVATTRDCPVLQAPTAATVEGDREWDKDWDRDKAGARARDRARDRVRATRQGGFYERRVWQQVQEDGWVLRDRW